MFQTKKGDAATGDPIIRPVLDGYIKMRKCWLPHVFSKGFFFRVVESWDYVVKS